MTLAHETKGTARQHIAESKLSIMSFNVGGHVSTRSEEYEWSCRAPLVAELIRTYRPHVVAMQEVQPGNVPALLEAFEDYCFFSGHATNTLPPSAEATYNTVFWQRQRFCCVASDSFYLSETPGEWSRSWGAESVRGAIWTLLEHRSSGGRFVFCCTHLDNRSCNARNAASRLIVERLESIRLEYKTPAIIAGDFNSRAWAPPNEDLTAYPPPVLPKHIPEAGSIFAIYSSAGYKDSFLEAGAIHDLDTNTYHDFIGEDFPPVALRIDWILYKDSMNQLRVDDYVVLKSPRLGATFPSDHYPVFASFSWQL